MTELVDKANKLLKENLDKNRVTRMAQLLEIQAREQRRHADFLKSVAAKAEAIEGATSDTDLNHVLDHFERNF
jgi:hypothetical protein